ncbi:hypothetical protein P22_3898 [Propionispora sp. 2/2-37]|nr:hypothetical protein P22_3898 [Propionispora sp. 2/2-37]
MQVKAKVFCAKEHSTGLQMVTPEYQSELDYINGDFAPEIL